MLRVIICIQALNLSTEDETWVIGASYPFNVSIRYRLSVIG